MEKRLFRPQDFAFARPLRWPEREKDRLAFKNTLVEYSTLMVALLEASEGNATDILLESLAPVLESLPGLWPSGNIPPEVARLIGAAAERGLGG